MSACWKWFLYNVLTNLTQLQDSKTSDNIFTQNTLFCYLVFCPKSHDLIFRLRVAVTLQIEWHLFQSFKINYVNSTSTNHIWWFIRTIDLVADLAVSTISFSDISSTSFILKCHSSAITVNAAKSWVIRCQIKCSDQDHILM